MFASIIAILLSGTAATPAPGASTATGTTPPAPQPRVVCRTVQQTGTRLGSRRVCRRVGEPTSTDEDGRQGRDVDTDLGRIADMPESGAGSPR